MFGHGVGTPIEKIMIERVGANFNTHSAYLYILNCGGICMFVLYIASATFLMQYHCRKRHYLIPLLIAVLTYGLF